MQTHAKGGEREKYFDDDDVYSLKALVSTLLELSLRSSSSGIISPCNSFPSDFPPCNSFPSDFPPCNSFPSDFLATCYQTHLNMCLPGRPCGLEAF